MTTTTKHMHTTTEQRRAARLHGVSHQLLRRRLMLGWSAERATTEPPRPQRKGWSR